MFRLGTGTCVITVKNSARACTMNAFSVRTHEIIDGTSVTFVIARQNLAFAYTLNTSIKCSRNDRDALVANTKAEFIDRRSSAGAFYTFISLRCQKIAINAAAAATLVQNAEFTFDACLVIRQKIFWATA